MPIYEYECTQCGCVEEMLQKISDKPLTACPHCSGKMHKLVSHSSFHLKGSGWYVTDYAKKSAAPPSTESDTPPKDSSSAKTDKASDKASKAAKKADD